jgi:hypothetical protein
MYNIGDLVEGWIGFTCHYGPGIIIERRSHGPQINSYYVYWSNNHPTWEAGRRLSLISGVK